MAWAAAIGPIIQMVTGAVKSAQAKSALSELPDPMDYKVSPEFKKFQLMSKLRAEQGASAAEEASFRERQAQQAAGAERNLRNMGLGAFSPATQAMYGSQANMDFTQMSENERRRGEVMFGNAAKTSMDVQHKQVSSFNDMLLEQQRALGGAAASANKDMAQGAMGIGSAATGAIQGMGGGMGGGFGGGFGGGYGRYSWDGILENASLNAPEGSTDVIGGGAAGTNSPFTIDLQGGFQQGLSGTGG